MTYKWDNKKPTAQMLGRWQPFHDGHYTLFKEIIKKTGQVCIQIRDVQGVNDNPFDFETVKKNIEDKGKCRYCGHWIYTEQGELNQRKSWHSRCADEYMFIYHSGETRKYIWQRDNGECAHCHELFPWRSRRNSEKWDVDHIRPLWEQKGKTFDEIDLTYWEEENLQTLCYSCHKKKSADEAARRAKMRKEGKLK